MADWNQPTNASAYTGVLTTINEKLQSSAKMDFTGDTNVPTGAIRHDGTTNKWQEWNGSSWVDLNVNFGGRVGIGTTSPSTGLDVQGVNDGTTKLATTRFSADTTPVSLGLRKSRGATVGTNTIVSSGDSVGQILFEAANGSDYNVAALILAAIDNTPGASNDMPGRLIFATTSDGSGGTTERMRIGSNGNIGIGTTSTANRLTVKGTGTGTSTCFRIIDSNDTENFRILDNGRVVAPETFNSTTANAANVNVDSAGNFQRSTSSIRYKTDVQDAVHGLAEVLLLRSVTYRGINDGNVIFGGLIAEELDVIGLREFVAYNAEGQPDAIAYGNMVSLLARAIQELNAKVEALEAQLAGA